jgi:hypothetical protein
MASAKSVIYKESNSPTSTIELWELSEEREFLIEMSRTAASP